MEQDARIRAIPLCSIPLSARDVLSNLLNGTKVIPTHGPEKLFRDWRGLCALANISSEVQASIRTSPDRTARVLERWSKDPDVLVGNLLDSLQRLDRFDVYEDVCAVLIKHYDNNRSIVKHEKTQIPPKITISDDSDIITYDDTPGYKQHYDAFVLYADQDQDFVNELIQYLTREQYQICTTNKVLPGYATVFAPVAKLISERCQRIILVYSPEFLDSPANKFFMDYAQAISIDSRTNKIIPIMYRPCSLPHHLAVYHMLHFDSQMYNFWLKLRHTVDIGRQLREFQQLSIGGSEQTPTAIQSSQSVVNIVEMTNSNQNISNGIGPPLSTLRSVSAEVLGGNTSSPEGSITSDTSDILKKKSSLITTMRNKFRRKKTKKPVEVLAS